MKKYILILALLLISSASFARSGDTYNNDLYCNVRQVTNGKCKQFDLIIAKDNAETIIVKYCDLERHVHITGTGVVCHYIGFERRQR